ncbi:MAG TPA: PEGA domain-containing protein [Verrucomicrobiae bacterium]|nr:PEGA domain-containing protein [Verrucomicrobiae bacterium]
MKNSIKKSIVLITLAAFVAGCSSTTVIHSKPEGAKVYLDSVYVGKTPYKHSDMKLVGATTPLELKLAGYQTFETHLSKDEKIDVGAIVGGCFFLFPFLWTMQYEPEHTYELVPAITNR